MLASSGTASAHTASRQATAFTPHLYVSNETVMTMNVGCKEMLVKGTGFAPGPVTLQATWKGLPLIVSPQNVAATVNGKFKIFDLIICGDGFSTSSVAGILVGIDHYGVQSNQVPV
jgi:hypothetical protein